MNCFHNIKCRLQIIYNYIIIKASETSYLNTCDVQESTNETEYFKFYMSTKVLTTTH